jgi:hypothetical protein
MQKENRPLGQAAWKRVGGLNPVSEPRRFTIARVYDDAGNVIETHEHKGDFQRVVSIHCLKHKAATR